MVPDVSKWERIGGILALVTILALNFWYVNWVNARSQERQCEVYAADLEVYAENPPDTPVRQKRYDVYKREWDNHCS